MKWNVKFLTMEELQKIDLRTLNFISEVEMLIRMNAIINWPIKFGVRIICLNFQFH